MKNKYSVICPTRKRVNNLLRFISSMERTVSEPGKLEYLFYIDIDDEETIDLVGSLPNSVPVIGPRVVFSSMFSILALKATGNILFMTGDDVIMQTDKWDLIVDEEFSKVKDQLLVVSTRDGIQNEKLATHSFIGKPWVDTLGYLVPNSFPGDWADNWLTDVSRGAGRLIYRPEIFVEHMHPNVGKGALDQTYIEKFKNTIKDKTDLRYQGSEMKELIAKDIAKLKAYINGKA